MASLVVPFPSGAVSVLCVDRLTLIYCQASDYSIQRYSRPAQAFQARDTSVINSVFETDQNVHDLCEFVGVAHQRAGLSPI